jgi:hypothetical protein
MMFCILSHDVISGVMWYCTAVAHPNAQFLVTHAGVSVSPISTRSGTIQSGAAHPPKFETSGSSWDARRTLKNERLACLVMKVCSYDRQ